MFCKTLYKIYFLAYNGNIIIKRECEFMNNISIIGRMGKDVEISTSQAKGTTIGKFSVGVTRKFDKTITDWFNCVAFGKTAEVIEQYIKKGNQIGVTGEIQFGSYDNKEGIKVYTTTLMVANFDFVGSNGQGNTSNSNNSSSFEEDMTPVEDGDMPF